MDFMRREGFLLIVFGGGYLIANRYNKYLDEVEHEIRLRERAERKKQKIEQR